MFCTRRGDKRLWRAHSPQETIFQLLFKHQQTNVSSSPFCSPHTPLSWPQVIPAAPHTANSETSHPRTQSSSCHPGGLSSACSSTGWDVTLNVTANHPTAKSVRWRQGSGCRFHKSLTRFFPAPWPPFSQPGQSHCLLSLSLHLSGLDQNQGLAAWSRYPCQPNNCGYTAYMTKFNQHIWTHAMFF